jgi:3-oxocholest-4-en-26-oate---CoA ligase
MNENLSTMLEAIADANPVHPALIQGGRTVTWGEFDERASRLAAHLAANGVGRGDRVAIDLYNSIEYLETLFAVTKLRATPVNVNYRYRESELAYVLDNSRSRALVFHQQLAPQVAAVAAARPDLALVIVLDGGDGAVAGAVEYEAALAARQPAPRVDRSGDDEFIVYTGGTTGMPKGAVWKHRNLVTHVNRGYEQAGLPTPPTVAELGGMSAVVRSEAPSVLLTIPPLMHSTAMVTTLRSLFVAGTVVLSTKRSFDPHHVLDLIAEHRVNDLTVVGDVVAKPLLAALDEARAAGRPYDVSSLRTMTSSGVTFSAATKLGLVDHGDFVITDVLACTEGGPFALSITKPGDDEEAVQFRITPNARVLDDELRDIPPGSGRVGRLAAKGSLPDGYLGDPERSAHTWVALDGERWVMPGDYASVEPDGTLQLYGRGSGVINTGGEKVFADEVQMVIAADPRVRDAVVVGVPDDRWGERIAAVVAAAPNRSLSEQDVVEIVAAELADYKKPRQVHFVDEIRRKATGKADLVWAVEVSSSRATGPRSP